MLFNQRLWILKRVARLLGIGASAVPGSFDWVDRWRKPDSNLDPDNPDAVTAFSMDRWNESIAAIDRMGAGMGNLVSPQPQEDYATRWHAAWAEIAKYCLGPHKK